MNLKQYVVCEEYVNGKNGYFTVRVNTDCSSNRFKVIATFDTFEEADKYIQDLRHLSD